MMFEIVFHKKKTSFPKMVNVLRPYVLPSRMRVREGSPKKKEIEKRGNIVNHRSKNNSKKRDGGMKNNPPKSHQKRRYKSIQNTFKIHQFFGTSPETTFWCFWPFPGCPKVTVDY